MPPRALALRLALFAATALAAGCTAGYGRVPDTASLQSELTPNVSTKADVLGILGPPRGYGMARFDPQSPRRVVWVYEFVKSNGFRVHYKMLLVFFDGDRYAGNLWFSSSDKVEWKD